MEITLGHTYRCHATTDHVLSFVSILIPFCYNLANTNVLIQNLICHITSPLAVGRNLPIPFWVPLYLYLFVALIEDYDMLSAEICFLCSDLFSLQ